MTSVPIMPLNVEELLSDKKMQRLMRGGETKAFWEWLLTVMWANKAWLPCDERVLCDMLDVDVRRWRNKYKPIFEQLLVREIEPIVGHIYRHPKLTSVWDDVAKRIEKNQRALEEARAQKAAKAKRQASAAEPKKTAATEPVTASAAEPAAGHHQNQDRRIRTLPIKQVESSNSSAEPHSANVDDDRVLAKPNGTAAADVGSPGLEGRSPPQPDEPVKPTPALLRSKLVAPQLPAPTLSDLVKELMEGKG